MSWIDRVTELRQEIKAKREEIQAIQDACPHKRVRHKGGLNGTSTQYTTSQTCADCGKFLSCAGPWPFYDPKDPAYQEYDYVKERE